jgi:hypothetical protein
MKIGELFGFTGGSLSRWGAENYLMGDVWKKPEMKDLGLRAKAEGLIDQNPPREKIAGKSCIIPEVSGK